MLVDAQVLDNEAAQTLLARLDRESVPRVERALRALLAGTGAACVAASVALFVAGNWQALDGRTKIALAAGLVLGAALVALRLGTSTRGGRAAVALVAMLLGPLLAVYGQQYQTGADPYELFVGWALLMLPLAVVARFGALWMLWLLVAQAAGLTFASQILGVRVGDDGARVLVVFLGVLHAGAVVVLERVSLARTGPRLAATGGVLWWTVPSVAILVAGVERPLDVFVLLATVGGLALLFVRYTMTRIDLWMAALVAAAASALVATAAGVFLFQVFSLALAGVFCEGAIIMGCAAVSARWLRSLSRGSRP